MKQDDQTDHLVPLKIKIVILKTFINTYSINRNNK